MKASSDPRVRSFSAEQGRRLLEVHRQVRLTTTRAPLRRLAVLISRILDVKAAFVAKVDDAWTVLAESRAEPALPLRGALEWAALDRLAALPEPGVRAWSVGPEDWTVTGLTDQGFLVFLVLEGDWTLCAATLVRLAENFQRVQALTHTRLRDRLGVVAHRLTCTLARAVGPKEIGAVLLRHVVRVVSSRIASFAVPTESGHLAIVATHGYPLEFVDWIRIAPGSGVIGLVYQTRLPLCVPDVTVLPHLAGQGKRYRTNSFIAVPVAAGTEVLGVLCAADPLDGRAFTRRDLARVQTLVAPAALALARERALRQADQLAKAAMIDPVSGLFNRRVFYDRLEEELQRARRHQTPVALIMIDLDDFKAVNDGFGHLAGDAVIRGVAEILSGAVRKFDVCTRFGGEEFAIIMPGTAAEKSAAVAERIRQRIEQFRPGRADWSALRVTASVGVSAAYDLSARELVDAADQALYAAKRRGKNRVIGWPR